MKRASTRIGLAVALGKVQPGATAKVDGGVWKYSIAPKYAVTVGGTTLPASMGTATAFAFQPLGGKTKAAITGDFALLAAQVNPVIRALRAHDIDVRAGLDAMG